MKSQEIHGPGPNPRHPRYPSLDLWRGIACLSVVFFHSTLFCHEAMKEVDVPGIFVAVTARGWVGVPVFFVISGYCISATADAARRRRHTTRDYFLRRFRRIFPPYWGCLGLAVLFALLLQFAGLSHLITGNFGAIASVPDPAGLDLPQWFGNLTLTEIWRPHVFGNGESLLLSQAWTLCYEEQFYAVTGFLLLLAPGRFFLAAAAVTLAVIAACPLGMAVPGVFWDGRWLLFAAGIAVYYALNYASPVGTAWIAVLLATGVAYDIFRRMGLLPSALTFTALHRNEALAAFSFAIAILALHPLDRAITASPLAKPLLFCGRMCYSLYLVHFPIALAVSHALFLAGFTSPAATVALTIPLAVGLSVAAGWAFHVVIERRFLNPPGPALSGP